ncbi:MAG: hypothetical protein E6G97_12815 [Alphaproteobacteria bacterium]|nr:MAG: hypothetical protein E6G97_12815 [Alphaproteobacteria bacterium]
MSMIRLSPRVEKRLARLAKKLRRTKSSLAFEAVVRHIEDLEDLEVARQRLARGGASIPLEQLESELIVDLAR